MAKRPSVDVTSVIRPSDRGTRAGRLSRMLSVAGQMISADQRFPSYQATCSKKAVPTPNRVPSRGERTASQTRPLASVVSRGIASFC
ncbi:MAG: hypothetical protein HQ581_13360 [Planctomycetes bacterium]|nr:hypothetical protein [Planctomycetota bacterium]